MGIQDRDYLRNGDRPRGGALSRLTPVVKALLVMNLGLYVLDLILAKPTGEKLLREMGAFTIQSALVEGQLWKLVTFQFLHGSIFHVLFNCMGIFFFGPWLERWWGSVKFLGFYLLCGVGGGLFFSLLVGLGVLPDGVRTGLIGASAGIYGILVGVAFIAPNLRVMLMIPPVELSMRQFAIGLIGLSVVLIALGIGGNEGGEAGHLGGALVGILLMRFPRLLGDGAGVVEMMTKPERPSAKIRPRSSVELDQDVAVDAILDKISSQGFQSLTQAERDVLQAASKAKQSGG